MYHDASLSEWSCKPITLLTIGSIHIRHVVIVPMVTSPQARSGGATQSNSAIMAGVVCSLVDNVPFDVRHVVQTTHMIILIIRQDHEDVWTL